jgi:phosphoribosylformylglycinamidine synthase subunit PurS
VAQRESDANLLANHSANRFARKNFSPRKVVFPTMKPSYLREIPPFRMKAKIIITPKKAVLDPQGKTVQTALEHMGYTGVTGVHIGKYIEIDLAPGTDKAAAQKAINDAAHKLLSNPVIEDYRLEITD